MARAATIPPMMPPDDDLELLLSAAVTAIDGVVDEEEEAAAAGKTVLAAIAGVAAVFELLLPVLLAEFFFAVVVFVVASVVAVLVGVLPCVVVDVGGDVALVVVALAEVLVWSGSFLSYLGGGLLCFLFHIQIFTAKTLHSWRISSFHINIIRNPHGFNSCDGHGHN
jgi:hypothetical protein